MNRCYTLEQYFEKVTKFREIVPNVNLGTDIIVGFPTETEEEFQMTCDVFQKIRYSVAFIFTYSARKGTPAFRWKDDVPEETKQARLHKLLQMHEEIATSDRQTMLGNMVEVLVERPTESGQLKGRTRCWKNVLFHGPKNLVGQLVKVKVTGYHHQTLHGELQ